MTHAGMNLQTAKPALLSKTLQFLAAGGLALVVAIWREIAAEDPDWMQIATLLAGTCIALGGGAYGRIVAQGPITSLARRAG